MAEATAPAAAATQAAASALQPSALQRAWELWTLRPLAARDIGRQVAQAGSADAATAWLLVALVELQAADVGNAEAGGRTDDADFNVDITADTSAAAAALHQARSRFTTAADARGLALCDEAQAVALRRAGRLDAAAALLASLDAQYLQRGVERDAMHRFIGHTARAATARLLGQSDAALRHFYAAHDAAVATGWAGPRSTALCNLGGCHRDLFNLDDARRLSEAALAEAREAGAPQTAITAASQLIVIHHAAGDMQQARAMAGFLLQHAEALLPGALARCALPLAVGHLAAGEVDAALAHLKPAGDGDRGQPADGDSSVFRAWLTGRCLLQRGDPERARGLAERTLRQRHRQRLQDQPYDLMVLYRLLSDACEQAGDAIAALTYMRQAHAVFEQLVGRSARARSTALELNHQLAKAQRERDVAVHRHRSVEDDHRRLAELNTALQAKVAETEMLHAKLREQALRDPLTGLHNRRYLFEMAPALLELARRQGKPLCVVLMDLDHFKLLNDTFGHAAGDLVLQRFSALLVQMLRRSDIVCRHGGEEFVAVMPDIDGQGAQAMLNRLLDAFQQQQNTLGTRRLPRGSFSAGIALFPGHGSTLEHLLSRADRGLYSAKNQGRARIELAPRTGFGAMG